jgi:hypothetical protein
VQRRPALAVAIGLAFAWIVARTNTPWKGLIAIAGLVLGDRIGVMRDGKLLQLASADEIYNRPVDLFVAHFTGASNLLAGRVLERNGDFFSASSRPVRAIAWPPGCRPGSPREAP